MCWEDVAVVPYPRTIDSCFRFLLILWFGVGTVVDKLAHAPCFIARLSLDFLTPTMCVT
jgi:hypothetical protein